MEQHDTLRRDTSPSYLSGMVNREMTKRIDQALRPLGVTLAQTRPLFMLAMSGPTLQRDILAHSAVGQSAMVTLLKNLEARGLIERLPHPTDRRASLFSLNERGYALVEAATPVIHEVNNYAASVLSSTERDYLASLLQRVLSHLISSA